MDEKLNISLIVIGDELLYGRTKDLNGQWLAQFLFKEGIFLNSIQFVSDSNEKIKKALDYALDESDIVITSGGIGPTKDDLTKSALANYFKKEIIEDQNATIIVTENYKRFKRDWIKSQNFYHHFPVDFVAINNPDGLAPGMMYVHNKKLIFSGPGVPREFKSMVEFEFLPQIRKYFSQKILPREQVHIRTMNVPEEKIFTELCPTLWEDLSRYGKVSSLPHTLGIDIVVNLSGHLDFNLLKQEIIQHIEKSPLKEYVWQYGNRPLSELVFDYASMKNITFSFAESCTGGLCSSKITDLSGSSKIFMGSIVSYDNKVKNNNLGVDPDIIFKHGAVSFECAQSMAINARLKLQTDMAVSITGIAGPTGGTDEKPVGTVYIGFSSKDKFYAKQFTFKGDRTRLKDRFSEMALLILYLELKG